MKSHPFIKNLYHNSSLEKREIDLIICHVLEINTAALFIFEDKITENQQQQINTKLQQREKGLPLAYITSSKAFWTLDLSVNKHTLIPRPETELIVELVLQLSNSDSSDRLLDLGTGTGAIALSIAQERPLMDITAVDYSSQCLHIAEINRNKYQLDNVKLLPSNWFAKLGHEKYHFIVSNPPYIAADDPHIAGLSFEPISALVAKNKGLADLQHIIQQARKHMYAGAYILLEHGYDQQQNVQAFLHESGYTQIQTHKDLAGIPRITTAQHENN
jgi:release factor glutamine methyltransferase